MMKEVQEKLGITVKPSTSTGFYMLDKRGGLVPSTLIVIAGDISQGKTSFALSITHNAIKSGAKIAFYSFEMSKEHITARMYAHLTGISPDKILCNPLNGEELKAINNAQQEIKSYGKNMIFDEKVRPNLDSLVDSIYSLKKNINIDGVVVDYLQLMNVYGKGTFSRYEEISEIVCNLKLIAKELNIWIVVLSQLNRDNDNPVPNLNRLRDSGQIAEAADMVVFVYRPEYYNRQFPEPFQNVDVQGKALIDISKGRNIGTFKFICGFDGSTTHFTNEMKEPSNNDPFNGLETYEDAPY